MAGVGNFFVALRAREILFVDTVFVEHGGEDLINRNADGLGTVQKIGQHPFPQFRPLR